MHLHNLNNQNSDSFYFESRINASRRSMVSNINHVYKQSSCMQTKLISSYYTYLIYIYVSLLSYVLLQTLGLKTCGIPLFNSILIKVLNFIFGYNAFNGIGLRCVEFKQEKQKQNKHQKLFHWLSF